MVDSAMGCFQIFKPDIACPGDSNRDPLSELAVNYCFFSRKGFDGKPGIRTIVFLGQAKSGIAAAANKDGVPRNHTGENTVYCCLRRG